MKQVTIEKEKKERTPTLAFENPRKKEHINAFSGAKMAYDTKKRLHLKILSHLGE